MISKVFRKEWTTTTIIIILIVVIIIVVIIIIIIIVILVTIIIIVVVIIAVIIIVLIIIIIIIIILIVKAVETKTAIFWVRCREHLIGLEADEVISQPEEKSKSMPWLWATKVGISKVPQFIECFDESHGDSFL
ncbi:hypothetical protein AALO_G00109010 [Alosa alosa]|uniref:Uncharacterized protein n=1 Tax=Alosa alosa TaxID=278164 RepID=A0AAV6GNE9_9TELE|nr:hypothetical protein AALO_G00109010 [Alosa alosa]